MSETATRPAGSSQNTAGVWLYRVVTIHARRDAMLEEGLAELGQEGWELVFMHQLDATDYRMVLRKPQ